MPTPNYTLRRIGGQTRLNSLLSISSTLLRPQDALMIDFLHNCMAGCETCVSVDFAARFSPWKIRGFLVGNGPNDSSRCGLPRSDGVIIFLHIYIYYIYGFVIQVWNGWRLSTVAEEPTSSKLACVSRWLSIQERATAAEGATVKRACRRREDRLPRSWSTRGR